MRPLGVMFNHRKKVTLKYEMILPIISVTPQNVALNAVPRKLIQSGWSMFPVLQLQLHIPENILQSSTPFKTVFWNLAPCSLVDRN
jgi:hypothetical protein